MSDRIQYKRGQAMRVFDVFGSVGFNVSENGQLGYFGPGGPWYAADGQWITRHPDGTLSVSGDDPELLLRAIGRYRKVALPGPHKNVPHVPTSPGMVLREEFLHPLRITAILGISPQDLRAILVGTASISLEVAQRLSQTLGTTADFWLNLQADFDQADPSTLRSRAKVALRESQRQVEVSGLSTLTLTEIDHEIAQARRQRHASRKLAEKIDGPPVGREFGSPAVQVWLQENAEAIQSYNTRVVARGVFSGGKSAPEPVTARQVQVAYQAFLSFARELHLTWHQKSLLLSVSERTLRRWATDTPHPNWDQQQRLGWILTIYYFAGKFIPGDALGWLTRPNSHPALKGMSPMARMLAGDLAGVLRIARSLEPWV